MTGEPGRFSREAFNRTYERELTELRAVLDGTKVSAPTTAAELYKLERLVRLYPDHARRLVAASP